ncbi:MAG: efflux RND transporter periplasmic adaptor subunit [Gemmatimonadetes bacterium]|nr:efflux RND transporter periplasmic adaptor subunit [Gemmatimonadota bacterium]
MMARVKHLAPLYAGLIVVAAGCGSNTAGAAESDAPRAVRIVAVEDEVVSRPIEAAGTLGPRQEITLAFKVPGVIASVRVDEGQTVSAGQVLAALDLVEIDAGVTRARATADDAERDFERARRLYADSVVTLAQLEDDEARRDMARADLESARVNRRYSVLVAPAAGVILQRRAEDGETVGAGTPVVVLGSRARGSVVRAGLADRDAVRVRIGDRATVQFDALEGRTFSGVVREIAAAAEPATGTFQVEIGVDGADNLGAGLVGRVEIVPRDAATYRMLPIEALLEADGKTATVFALAPGRVSAERRTVRIAFLAGDLVAIAAGLDGVEAVVTDGAAYLRDGENVRVVQ